LNDDDVFSFCSSSIRLSNPSDDAIMLSLLVVVDEVVAVVVVGKEYQY